MASPAYPLYPDASATDPRYCEICERYERCHCPRMKSWCSTCCPLVGPLPKGGGGIMISNQPRALPVTKLVARVHHAELEQIEQGECIETRLQSQGQIDQRSDAYFYRAFQLADIIERSPGLAVEYARLIKQAIRDGMALDEMEDEHRAGAMVAAVMVQDLGRGVVLEIDRYWGVSNLPEGA